MNFQILVKRVGLGPGELRLRAQHNTIGTHLYWVRKKNSGRLNTGVIALNIQPDQQLFTMSMVHCFVYKS